jgi:hypothetical protein
MNSPSLISSAKESGAYIRVNKEVEQNDYGNDHAADNQRGGRMIGLREFEEMSHKANHFNNHCQPEGPAFEQPEAGGEDEGEYPHNQGKDSQDNSQRIHDMTDRGMPMYRDGMANSESS